VNSLLPDEDEDQDGEGEEGGPQSAGGGGGEVLLVEALEAGPAQVVVACAPAGVGAVEALAEAVDGGRGLLVAALDRGAVEVPAED